MKPSLLLCFLMALLPTWIFSQTVVVDNASPQFSIELGVWETGTATGGKYGPDYRFANTVAGGPTARCRFTPNLPTTGYYYVSVWYNTGTNRSTNAPYTVHGDQGTSTVLVNQQINGADWFYIGQMHFAAGTAGSVSLANNANNLVVMADAVQFVYAGATPGPEPGGGGEPGGNDDPEMRGLWVSRFEWPNSSQSVTKGNIDNVINLMASANFNALFLQVRGAMETHYPSPNEPWARAGFNYQPQSYDPMQYAIDKAHAAGLEFHAYINTHAVYQGTAPPLVPGGQPVHPFYTHGNPADPDPAKHDWTFHTAPNTPQQMGEGEENYIWTAPGVPTFQQWTRDQVVYVAQNYNVDGVHFDRIRFAGQGSYDPISLVRSQPGNPGNPDNLSFRDWNRDQITRLLNDIYGAIAEINYNSGPTKRTIAVSTAPFRGKSQQESVNQMLGAWSSIGAQDFFCPQVYTTSMSSFSSVLATNFPLAFGRGVVAGLTRNLGGQTIGNVAAQIQEARNQGAMGSVIFSYSGFQAGDWNALKSSVYSGKAEVPDMPWLTAPTDAIIVGNITNPADQPLVDVQLSRPGSSYKWLSGSDGFYAMLKVPAGEPLTITANGTQYEFPERTVTVPALSPGEVRRVNIKLGVTAVREWMLY